MQNLFQQQWHRIHTAPLAQLSTFELASALNLCAYRDCAVAESMGQVKVETQIWDFLHWGKQADPHAPKPNPFAIAMSYLDLVYPDRKASIINFAREHADLVQTRIPDDEFLDYACEVWGFARKVTVNDLVVIR